MRPERQEHAETPSSPASNQLKWTEIDRATIAGDFRRVRGATEALGSSLSAEDQNLQSMPETSPVKWHRAHTSWFFETFLLKPHQPSWREINPAYNHLFNSYYNDIGKQYPRPRRNLLSRPDIAAIREYRGRVDQAMLQLIDRCPESKWRELVKFIVLGLNHEQQHQELIVTDIKHAFSHNPLYPTLTADIPDAGTAAGAIGWIPFDGGVSAIGADEQRFCFDNETPRHEAMLQAFELASRPVTCSEYLDFINDGGYETPTLWLADGWEWVQSNGIDSPLYWQHRDGQWFVYTLSGLRPLRAEEILCHVSFYEAQAFAEWAGARLPTEAEWEVAASRVPEAGHFASSGRLHPAAATVGAEPVQMFGDVWEWTASSYAAYPGFAPAAGAVGEYNGKFMANQMVLRGGSCATPAGHIRSTYRNFFYPKDRWQFSGIRLARTP